MAEDQKLSLIHISPGNRAAFTASAADGSFQISSRIEKTEKICNGRRRTVKNREMEEKIKTAFQHAAPDVLESVLSDCGEQKGTVITLTEKKKIRWIKAARCV